MRVVRRNNVFVIQLQRADESFPQFGEEVKRTAKERHMSTDRFTAGKTADGLVYHCLEDRRRKVFLGGSFVDQRLNVRLGKHTAAGRDGIERLIIFCVLVQTGGIRLQERSHLVDKRTCTSGTDSVHALFDISAFKINDLGVLAAQFNGNVCLGRIVLERRGNRDDLLDKGYAEVLCKRETAASGDDRRDLDGSEFVKRPS